MVFKSIIGATSTCLTVVSLNTNAALVSLLWGQAVYDRECAPMDINTKTFLLVNSNKSFRIISSFVPAYF